MKDKIILITGSTSGLGKVAAIELAKKGGKVILHGRNKEKAEKVKAEVIKASGNNTVTYLIADFTSLAQIKGMAEEFIHKFDRLDVLINNAGGIMDAKRSTTQDGVEITFGVNVLSHFLLTARLFDKLKSSKHARIINISSEAHKAAKPDFNDIQMECDYNAHYAYSNSKLYNYLFTRELHRKLVKNGIMNISVNAMHPGVVATNFALESSSMYNIFFKFFKPVLLTPEQGADTIIYLASHPEAERFSGAYFKKRKIKFISSKYATKENAQKLWENCEKLSGQKFL